MVRRLLRSASLAVFCLLTPLSASALEQRSINVPGLNFTVAGLLNNITSFLAVTAVSFCLALFLIGAFMMVIGAHDETKIKTAKDVMTHALMGLAVVIGSYGILRTALYIVMPPN